MSPFVFVPFLFIPILQLFIILRISKKEIKYHANKRLWTNIVLFVPLIGAGIYLLKEDKIFPAKPE